jgi:hypothetical protein
MAGVMQTFGAAISALQSVEGFGLPGRSKTSAAGTAVRFGRFAASKESHVGASILITLDKEDLSKAMGRLNVYKSIPSDIAPEVLNDVAFYFLKDIIPTNFETESGPLGAWPQLSFTQAARRGGSYHPILIHKGDLFSHVTDSNWMEGVAVSGKYSRLLLGPQGHWDELTIFKYYVHNLGSSNAFGKGITIPPRPFMPSSVEDLTNEQRKNINQIVIKGIQRGLEQRLMQKELNKNPASIPTPRGSVSY